MNLIQGLRQEITRNEALLKEYGAIGPAGMVGVATISCFLEKAKMAIDSGDVVEMLKVYKNLEGTK